MGGPCFYVAMPLANRDVKKDVTIVKVVTYEEIQNRLFTKEGDRTKENVLRNHYVY